MPANGANIAALCHRAWSLSSHIHVPTRWSLPETLRGHNALLLGPPHCCAVLAARGNRRSATRPCRLSALAAYALARPRYVPAAMRPMAAGQALRRAARRIAGIGNLSDDAPPTKQSRKSTARLSDGPKV